MKMEPTGCPETSVTNYYSTLCNIPEERRSHLRRGGHLNSGIRMEFTKIRNGLNYSWFQACVLLWMLLFFLLGDSQASEFHVRVQRGLSYVRWRLNICQRGPGSSVGIATGYGLDGPGIESRWGARFSAPVQTDHGAHPASYTMGSVSFPGIKRGQGVTLIPLPFLVPWSWKGRAIPQLPLWVVRPVQSLIACTRVHFTFLRLVVANGWNILCLTHTEILRRWLCSLYVTQKAVLFVPL